MNPFRRRADRPMNCRQVGRRLQTYLDGELDDLTARRIMRHLDDCRRCGMEAAAYTQLKASIARRADEPPDDAIDRLRAFGERLIHEGPPGDADLPDESAGS
ncbi:MAG: anti-sigma factor family protein [Acidimicrobiales bacterium]